MIEYIDDIEPQKKNWLMGDYPMWLWINYHYKIKFIPEVTSVYRILEESASHSKDIIKMKSSFYQLLTLPLFILKNLSSHLQNHIIML